METVKLRAIIVSEKRRLSGQIMSECTLCKEGVGGIPYIHIEDSKILNLFGTQDPTIIQLYDPRKDMFNFSVRNLLDIIKSSTSTPDEIRIEFLEVADSSGKVRYIRLQPGLWKEDSDGKYRMCDAAIRNIIMDTKIIPMINARQIGLEDGTAITLLAYPENNLVLSYFDDEDDEDCDCCDEDCEGCVGKCKLCSCKYDEDDEDDDECDITDEHLVNIGCTGDCANCTDTCDGWGDEEDTDGSDVDIEIYCSCCNKYDKVTHECKCDHTCKACFEDNIDNIIPEITNDLKQPSLSAKHLMCNKCKDCDFSLCVHSGKEGSNNFQMNTESLYPKTIRDAELPNTKELPKVILNKEQSLKLKKKRK